ncbi:MULTISPECIES: hypothetical protein [unclassified Pseudomonas]|uniref:hypothetical protein n=1 Tax=unclassified Pseudomonas TaxID=196821 RepID=UPI00119B314D|nr:MULTISPECIES: hypothetical protein [unclassified Pseudomonas]TWC14902.1 hypothetical protein FBY00_11698 [Pseudomonas sp. SJZ075]TWC24297.1 hypothetical protein FBX99_103377 [Pseudomonas sp. SJZ074]TWC31180.1 hypothetical protein FBY02_11521 [Pseudomonas sp. SJZ078]TWC42036.1 hypothetical protein FBY06_102377 [Pseudomonas sp. SJZ085]TWC52196.1 hypothetical protein FBY11_11598 [Pseudomonas sp. SJZ124]
MASANKQQKRNQRAKAKAKQNRVQRAAAPNDFLDPNDERIDLETVDLSDLFNQMRIAEKVSQQAMCAAFLGHPLLALVLEQEGEEEATDFIFTALIEYRRLTMGVDEQTALDWVESPQFQADYVAASRELTQASD